MLMRFVQRTRESDMHKMGERVCVILFRQRDRERCYACLVTVYLSAFLLYLGDLHPLAISSASAKNIPVSRGEDDFVRIRPSTIRCPFTGSTTSEF